MKVVAFVPIRLNSQRVAGKNLRLLAGEPLMCHILRTLCDVPRIDEIHVYCSDESIRAYLPAGVRFLRRSPSLDRNDTLGREIYDAFTAEVEADIYVLAHATSPKKQVFLHYFSFKIAKINKLRRFSQSA